MSAQTDGRRVARATAAPETSTATASPSTEILPLTANHSGVELNARPAALRAAAHAARRRGWSPIPLHEIDTAGACTCRRGTQCPSAGKHPQNAGWASAPPLSGADIEETWRDGSRANLGIRTGAASGGLVVLDEDRPGALDELAATLPGGLPTTYTVRTGGGGLHAYLHSPAGVVIRNSAGTLHPGVDVRGEGGQVVAPPSVTAHGGYIVLDDVPVADVPPALLERLQRPSVRRATQAHSQGGPVYAGTAHADLPDAERARLLRYGEIAWASELSRLDALPRPWHEGAGWDATTYAVACAGLDLADSPWCHLDAEQVAADVHAHAPTDELWTARYVAAKMASARNRASSGRGRPLPEPDAILATPNNAAAPAVSTTTGDPEPGPGRPHLRERALTIAGLAGLAPVEPLVEGLLYRGTLAQLSGRPGGYKTFLSLGMALSVATGRAFHHHTVPRAGAVVYVAAEGSTGLLARVLAWCQHNEVDFADLEGTFYVIPEPVQLGSTLDVTEAAEFAAEVGAALLVLDTRARCTLGLEENSATEQGRAIHGAEAIQRASGATVLVVHHAGRAGDHGRGSTAWDGAVWSDLRAEGADLRAQITCAKHKDVPDGCVHEFGLREVEVAPALMPGVPATARSTLVTVQNGLWTAPVAERKNERIVQKIVWTAGQLEGLPPGVLRDLAMEAGASRSGAYAGINALVTAGFLRNVGSTRAPRYVTDRPAPDPERPTP